jgi:N-methylhydantoinase B
VTPIFHNEKLVAFCANMAHKPDIGGSVPGSASGQSTEIFQEGLLLPPVKYIGRGQINKEVKTILRANTRTPELLMGDLNGQVGTCRIGEQRIQKLMDKYGQDTVLIAFNQLLDKTEAHVRSEISQWKDGSAETETIVDNDGVELEKPIRLHLRTTKKGSSLTFDFTQSSDQTLGPSNLRPAGSRSACCFALITMIDPNINNNEGLARVFETKLRKHSILDPESPAPVSCYSSTIADVLEMVIATLTHLAGKKAIAYSGAGIILTMGGKSLATGNPYIQYEIMGRGGGAVDGDDGIEGPGQLHGSQKTIKSVPIEIVESEFACRLLRYEKVPDTGGAGKFRGGLAYIREYLILDEKARVTLRGNRIIAPGVEGGLHGTENYAILNPGTPEERLLPTRTVLFLKKGDVLRLVSGSGGGVGNPLDRDRQKVSDDVEDGYVTPEKAQEIYGLKTRGINYESSGSL